MLVKEFMRKNPITLTVNNVFGDAVDIFCKEKVQGIPVLSESNEVVGMITKSMAISYLNMQTPKELPIEQVMKKDVVVMDENQDIDELVKWPIGTLPIIKDKDGRKNIVGIYYLDDTINTFHFSAQNMQDTLYGIINSMTIGVIAIDNHIKEVVINDVARQILGFRNEIVTRDDVITELSHMEIERVLFNDENCLTQILNSDELHLKVVRKKYYDQNGMYSKLFITIEQLFYEDSITTINSENGIVCTNAFNRDSDFTFSSQQGQELLNDLIMIGKVDSTVLITGESGTGKEVAAKLIVENGNRADKPFIKINCGAIPENLIETELFGYYEGAFTGASKNGRKGVFEAADGGTIFLDEISELPMHSQVKLLRVLQEREIVRVGGTEAKSIDVRVITATNKNLKELVNKGEFRQDLYYRLDVIPVTIPPLRERKNDIVEIANNIIDFCRERYGIEKDVSEEAFRELIHYTWPGNIRELQNVVERAMVTTKQNTIESFFENRWRTPDNIFSNIEEMIDHYSYKELIQMFDKKILDVAMSKYGSTRGAANALKIDQSTIVKKMKNFK